MQQDLTNASLHFEGKCVIEIPSFFSRRGCSNLHLSSSPPHQKEANSPAPRLPGKNTPTRAVLYAGKLASLCGAGRDLSVASAVEWLPLAIGTGLYISTFRRLYLTINRVFAVERREKIISTSLSKTTTEEKSNNDIQIQKLDASMIPCFFCNYRGYNSLSLVP